VIWKREKQKLAREEKKTRALLGKKNTKNVTGGGTFAERMKEKG